MSGARQPAERPQFEVFVMPDPQSYKVVTTLRIDVDLLRRIDKQAKKRGISRTAYILMATSKALEEGL